MSINARVKKLLKHSLLSTRLKLTPSNIQNFYSLKIFSLQVVVEKMGCFKRLFYHVQIRILKVIVECYKPKENQQVFFFDSVPDMIMYLDSLPYGKVFHIEKKYFSGFAQLS